MLNVCGGQIGNASDVEGDPLTRIRRRLRRPWVPFRRLPVVGSRLLGAQPSAAAAARIRHPCGRRET